jgi:hypothetical protein
MAMVAPAHMAAAAVVAARIVAVAVTLHVMAVAVAARALVVPVLIGPVLGGRGHRREQAEREGGREGYAELHRNILLHQGILAEA